MDPLKIDFKTYEYEIIDAITEVYGPKYYQIIWDRFYETIFVPYTNLDGIKAYYHHLESCKAKELSLEFLSQLGIDINKYNIKTFEEPLPEELKDLCYGYLGSIYSFEEYNLDDDNGFKSFLMKYNQDNYQDIIISNQIEFINFIRGTNAYEINEENFQEFSKTDEYQEIYNLALKLDEIYEPLVKKMKTYLSSIKEYKDYYINEERRLNQILNQKREELYLVLENSLPRKIKEILDQENNLKDKTKKFFISSLDDKSCIEYFSEEDEIKLKDPNIPNTTKKYIYRNRLLYLRNMGLDINVWKEDYNELIKREEVKELIPNKNFVNKVIKLRLEYLDSAKEEFILQSDTFKEAMKYCSNNSNNRKQLLHIIKNTEVCMTLGNNTIKPLIPYVFLTMRKEQCGVLDYVIIHEIIHAIESSLSILKESRTGFEPNVYSIDYSPYPHKKRKRKYERLNETIVDILTLEVRQVLFKKGIYLAEPKNRTKIDASEYNTTKFLKDLLIPFYSKYRNLIIETRIYGNIEKLTNEIGIENYENLNDIIDHIDYLIEQGLLIKLEENNINNPLVLEYTKLLNELNTIYSNIDVLPKNESEVIEQKDNNSKKSHTRKRRKNKTQK